MINEIEYQDLDKLERIAIYQKDFFLSLISLKYPISKRLQIKFKNILNIDNINQIKLVQSEELLRNFLFKNNFSSIDIKLPWSIEFIELYKDDWDWISLSKNTFLPWSEELIDVYKNRWDWDSLSKNQALPWSEGLIEKYIDKWNWSSLSKNHYLPWSFSLINKFIDKKTSNEYLDLKIELEKRTQEEIQEKKSLYESNYKEINENRNKLNKEDLDELHLTNEYFYLFYNAKGNEEIEIKIKRYEYCWEWASLSANTSLPWSSELIETYKDQWNWYFISKNTGIPWSKNLINKFLSYWDWISLSLNPDLPWSQDMLASYKDKWNWVCISENKNIFWTRLMLENYRDDLRWEYLSNNSNIDWSEELIDKYKDKWDWVKLSSNEFIIWSNKLINKFEHKISWVQFSGNTSVEWSTELIQKHKENYDWDVLSLNKSLPWSLSFIEKFKDNWNWKGLIEEVNSDGESYNMLVYGLSHNYGLPWSIQLIDKYKDKWDWYGLSNNISLPWSINLLDRYLDKWVFENLDVDESIYSIIFQSLPENIIEHLLNCVNDDIDMERVFMYNGVGILHNVCEFNSVNNVKFLKFTFRPLSSPDNSQKGHIEYVPLGGGILKSRLDFYTAIVKFSNNNKAKEQYYKEYFDSESFDHIKYINAINLFVGEKYFLRFNLDGNNNQTLVEINAPILIRD